MTNFIFQIIEKINFFLINNKSLLIRHLTNIFFSLIILFTGLFFSKKINKITNKIISSHKIDKTIKYFLLVVIKYFIIILTLIATLNNLGIETTFIITILGATGLTIGLALKESLSNFAAGILLILFRPFKIGEKVILCSIKGVVEKIQIFSTSIYTKDNSVVIIPNNKIINNNIINISRKPNKRTKIIINVSYNSNIDLVKKTLYNVIIKEKRVKIEKGITINLHEMAESSLNFIIYIWTKNSDAKKVYWNLMENFKKQLDINNINIPFKQIDVYLYKKK